jgi:hypothetical protein
VAEPVRNDDAGNALNELDDGMTAIDVGYICLIAVGVIGMVVNLIIMAAAARRRRRARAAPTG